ncbi:MAG TPA: D-aminoacylase [Acidobacteriota bacterium]|nr:D-aminoacylase [Acidobacteriota bacterium]
MDRRRFLKNSLRAAAAFALTPNISAEASSEFDLVLRGGFILDGTGGPVWKGDLGIKGDTIAALGEISPTYGKNALDISGWYVSPGFIDIHSHSDGSILGYPEADSRVRQGITTEITGNCGSSAAPIEGQSIEAARKEYMDEYGVNVNWSDVASFFDQMEKQKMSLNQALLLGQGTLRTNIAGEADRTLTADEMKKVLRMVEEGMDSGAVGLSTGLEYVPGTFTPTEEIIEMNRIVARYGGFYASHIRNEVTYVLEAVDEAINIGRQTGSRAQVSHLKVCGRSNWHKQAATLDLIESARKEGVEVLADAYPYTAYSTGLTLVMYSWAREGGSDAIVKRLQDPETKKRIRAEVLKYVAEEPGGFDLIVISSVSSDKNRNCVGKNIAQISEMWKMEPVDACLRLIEEEKAAVSYIGHAMSPENVELVLSHPLVMVSSDGYSIAAKGKALQQKLHPRSYGTYPRFLAHYIRERKIVDLSAGIRKMTSMPAEQSGLSDRGRIAKGKKADLVVFDPTKVQDTATFDSPHQYPTGIAHVFVNGVQVVKDGNHTGARPGKVLRKA